MEAKMIRIPFEVEKAKKIQTGELPGKIVTREGNNVEVVYWDLKNQPTPVVVVIEEKSGKYEYVGHRYIDGHSQAGRCCVDDLIIQVPEWVQFKDGDILTCEVDCGGGEYYKWFSILKGEVELMFGNINFNSYVSYDHETSYNAGELTYDEHADNIDTIRLATEEEKQKFVKRLQEEQTDKAKYILKRFFGMEEKPECEFKPKDLVLCRLVSNVWCLCQFSNKETDLNGELWYVVVGGNGFKECIPYNEQTKHLLGTTDNWEE